MNRIFTILSIVVLCGFVAAAAEDGDGGLGGAYLQVPIGARPTALGGAYVAISDDGAGPLYNPAGIANLRKALFTSSYRLMQLDRTMGYVSLLIPTARSSTLGFSWLYAGSGSVEARNTDGDLLGYDLTQHNHSFSVMFAKRFESYLAAGFRGSYHHSQFAEMTSFSVALDLGVVLYISQLYKREKRETMAVQDITVGFVIRNLGAKYRWNNEKYLVKHSTGVMGTEQEDGIPIEVGLGGSARFMKRKLVLAADVNGDEETRFTFHGGAEYFVSPQLALRAGYGDKRLSAGTGYVFNFSNTVLAIDYAFSTEKAGEGSEHIFSFDLLF